MARASKLSTLRGDIDHEIVAPLKTKYDDLDPDALFCLWFVQWALAKGDVNEAHQALAGGSGDHDIDAMYIDEKAVHIVQTKYHEKASRTGEKRAPISTFADLAEVLMGDKEDLTQFLGEPMSDLTKKKLKTAWAKTHAAVPLRLKLYFVSLHGMGKAAGGAKRKAKKHGADFLAFDATGIAALLDSYRDARIPIGQRTLAIDQTARLPVLDRLDPQNNIQAYAFTTTGSQIAMLADDGTDEHGIDTRLFAANPRGFQGEANPVNQAVLHTLVGTEAGDDGEAPTRPMPEYFLYFNNGLTVVCEDAELVPHASARPQSIRMSEPQIVNGQQTTRVLHGVWADDDTRKYADRARVLLRVLVLKRKAAQELIPRIVGATNWQTKIELSDLRANDPKQIELQRALEMLNFHYVRKRQPKTKAKADFGKQGGNWLTKFDFAQGSAACAQEGLSLRAGKEALFDNDNYDVVFPSLDPYYYLTRYYLWRFVRQQAAHQGTQAKQWGKWLAVFFLWAELQGAIEQYPQRFVRSMKSPDDSPKVDRALFTLTGGALNAASAFYKARGGRLIESQFFKSNKMPEDDDTTLWEGFQDFWARRENRDRRGTIASARDRFVSALVPPKVKPAKTVE